MTALPEMLEATPVSEPTRPIPLPPAKRSRGGGIGPFAVAMFVAGSIVGGVAGVGAATLTAHPVAIPIAPAIPSFATTRVASSTDASSTVTAVDAVLPAVVTVINKGATGAEVGSGSGLVIDKDLGYVVTNSHVVEQTRTTQPARFIDVVLSDGTRKAATVVGNDPSHDVAVLKVDGGLPAQATLADSSAVPLGAPVVAIGSPGIVGSRGGSSSLLQNTITAGVVSGKDRQLPRADLRNNVQLTDLIQTDAAINPGNSGGPLVWVATKQVIGLNTLVVRGSGEEGLGFAVSSDTVKQIASQLIARGNTR
jgi:putative serine protease PepD